MIKSIQPLLPQPLPVADKKDIWLVLMEDSELLYFPEKGAYFVRNLVSGVFNIYNSKCILYSNATEHVVHPPSKASKIYDIATGCSEVWSGAREGKLHGVF